MIAGTMNFMTPVNGWRVAAAAACVLSLAWMIGGCQVQPSPGSAADRPTLDLTGSWHAEYARDDGNRVTVSYDLPTDTDDRPARPA